MADGQSSPYSALSAMAIDPIFIAVGDVPEFAEAGGEPSLTPGQRGALEQVRRSRAVDHGSVRDLKTQVLRVPARASEEDLVIGLLESRGTLAHPGYFFDFPHEAFLILSLLPDAAVFSEGIARLLEHVRG